MNGIDKDEREVWLKIIVKEFKVKWSIRITWVDSPEAVLKKRSNMF